MNECVLKMFSCDSIFPCARPRRRQKKTKSPTVGEVDNEPDHYRQIKEAIKSHAQLEQTLEARVKVLESNINDITAKAKMLGKSGNKQAAIMQLQQRKLKSVELSEIYVEYQSALTRRATLESRAFKIVGQESKKQYVDLFKSLDTKSGLIELDKLEVDATNTTFEMSEFDSKLSKLNAAFEKFEPADDFNLEDELEQLTSEKDEIETTNLIPIPTSSATKHKSNPSVSINNITSDPINIKLPAKTNNVQKKKVLVEV